MLLSDTVPGAGNLKAKVKVRAKAKTRAKANHLPGKTTRMHIGLSKSHLSRDKSTFILIADARTIFVT